jgi:hypothetical protein
MFSQHRKQAAQTKAVVDWVVLEVHLGRASHGGYLKNTYDALGVSHVDPIDPSAGGAASRFHFRVQDPDSAASLQELLDSLANTYGLVSEVFVKAIEVSVDFHEGADEATLDAVTHRLMRSITPPLDQFPRLIGDGRDLASPWVTAGANLDTSKSLMIGNEDDDLMWRVYQKRTDRTVVDDSGKRIAKPISPANWRARAEVRIQRGALAVIGLSTFAELCSFRFESLHSKGYFKFTMPSSPENIVGSNSYSRAAFKSLGIDGDAPAAVLNTFWRNDDRGRRRLLSGKLATDQDLTEACRHALRRLTGSFGYRQHSNNSAQPLEGVPSEERLSDVNSL